MKYEIGNTVRNRNIWKNISKENIWNIIWNYGSVWKYYIRLINYVYWLYSKNMWYRITAKLWNYKKIFVEEWNKEIFFY